ncbi:MAG: AAA family ATPase [Candidatus Rokubacteria bacterium]|nr:AAA family ATPase [Candidatus Rokubacteria bacterium]
MRCSRCNVENREGRRFCSECGAALVVACPACGFSNESGEKFCGGCGALLVPAQQGSEPKFDSPRSYTPKHLAERILTSKAALEGERKQVTVLFCDLVDSTGLAERLGPEAMHTLLDAFFRLALTEVHRYEGTINQFLGDGFMALFGAPIAHENHARAAVLVALGVQRALAAHQTELVPDPGLAVATRIGINSGAVVVGRIGDDLRMDYTAIGDTTNLAARLQQFAEPGSILLSEPTSRLVRGHVRQEPLGLISLKGKSEPIPAYRVLGAGPRRSPLEILRERPLSPFVGRERELSMLHSLLDNTARGEGQVVAIVAEPGVGKSRLLLEFCQNLLGRLLTYLEGRCVSYGSAIPLLPVLEIVRNNCGITDTDTPEEIAGKIRFGFEEVGLEPGERVGYLLHALGLKEAGDLDGLAPEAIKARTFEALRLLGLQGSQRRLIVFVVEDCHWIDKSSEEYFNIFAESLVEAKILFIATFRPGYRPPWMDKSYATQIALHRLSSQDSLSIVRSILPTPVTPTPLEGTILERAEGNPFFLEELSRAVSERPSSEPTLAIPGTIQDVIMARIDLLHDDTKRLVQTASVLGREFPRSLLAATWEGSGDLDVHLRQLIHLEFLSERRGASEPGYVFRHALTQEVAYGSLLTPNVHRLHAAAGQALEAIHANRLGEVAEQLAYHYAHAGQADKAAEYLLRAGDKAAAVYGLQEAVTAYRDGLFHAERLPVPGRDHRSVELSLRLGNVFLLQGNLDECRNLLIAQAEHVGRLGDPMLRGSYHAFLGLVYSLQGNRGQARAHASQGLAEARGCGDEITMGRAVYVLASESLWAGELVEAVALGREAAILLERTGEQWWLGVTCWMLGTTLGLLGQIREGLETLGRVDAIGAAIGDPRLLSTGDWASGLLLAFAGEHEESIRRCARGLDRSPDPLNSAFALGTLGYAHREAGNSAEALPRLDEAAGLMGLFGFRAMQAWFMAEAGEASLGQGDLERAQDLIGQALPLAREVGFGLAVGLAQRVLGLLARRRGDLAEAEARIREALETFTRSSAALETGRTLLILADLVVTRGNAAAAAELLSEAHRLFRERDVGRLAERASRLAATLGLQLGETET